MIYILSPIQKKRDGKNIRKIKFNSSLALLNSLHPSNFLLPYTAQTSLLMHTLSNSLLSICSSTHCYLAAARKCCKGHPLVSTPVVINSSDYFSLSWLHWTWFHVSLLLPLWPCPPVFSYLVSLSDNTQHSLLAFQFLKLPGQPIVCTFICSLALFSQLFSRLVHVTVLVLMMAFMITLCN